MGKALGADAFTQVRDGLGVAKEVLKAHGSSLRDGQGIAEFSSLDK
jgi:hypothetical protein